SDVYSAGLVLYEMLCGVRPFDGESETETLRLVRRGEIPDPTVYRPELPKALNTLVQRALAFDPADRYQTAGAMRLSLLHHLAVSESGEV
ncbi:MAG: protein kinase, partial [SAR202 cluster bacterium]|nr:protein kinase [SAR202 cluster bacterium]